MERKNNSAPLFRGLDPSPLSAGPMRPDQRGTLAFVGSPAPNGGLAPFTVSEARGERGRGESKPVAAAQILPFGPEDVFVFFPPVLVLKGIYYYWKSFLVFLPGDLSI